MASWATELRRAGRGAAVAAGARRAHYSFGHLYGRVYIFARELPGPETILVWNLVS